MLKTKFDLEQEILACWHVVDDIKLTYETVYDNPEFTGMSATAQDKLSNLLIGLETLYQLKFEKCFNTFEQLVK